MPWRDVAPYPGAPVVQTSLLAEDAGELARLAPGRKVLEIGSAYGYSAAVMMHAGARYLLGIDPHGWLPYSRRVWSALLSPFPTAHMVPAPAEAVAPTLLDDGERFGLIFVDGDHAAPAVEHDVKAAMQLLAAGGVVAVHDYLEDCCCPDVRTVLDRLYPGQGRVIGSMWVWESPVALDGTETNSEPAQHLTVASGS